MLTILCLKFQEFQIFSLVFYDLSEFSGQKIKSHTSLRYQCLFQNKKKSMKLVFLHLLGYQQWQTYTKIYCRFICRWCQTYFFPIQSLITFTVDQQGIFQKHTSKDYYFMSKFMYVIDQTIELYTLRDLKNICFPLKLIFN